MPNKFAFTAWLVSIYLYFYFIFFLVRIIIYILENMFNSIVSNQLRNLIYPIPYKIHTQSYTHHICIKTHQLYIETMKTNNRIFYVPIFNLTLNLCTEEYTYITSCCMYVACVLYCTIHNTCQSQTVLYRMLWRPSCQTTIKKSPENHVCL